MKKKVFLFYTIVLLLAVICFAQETVVGGSLIIGDVGPGGGLVFYIEGNKYWECSELLGDANWYEAVKICEAYNGGGYSDWYLPSMEELSNIYKNLRETDRISGDTAYWSSSSYDYHYEWGLQFSDGTLFVDKTEDKIYSVRAVRVFTN